MAQLQLSVSAVLWLECDSQARCSIIHVWEIFSAASLLHFGRLRLRRSAGQTTVCTKHGETVSAVSLPSADLVGFAAPSRLDMRTLPDSIPRWRTLMF